MPLRGFVTQSNTIQGNNMLLFIAPYPNQLNEKDGMIQRIASIDEAISDRERTYLDISFRRHLNKTTECTYKLTIHHVNFFIHFLLILHLIIKARVIYVHSIYNALKIMPFYPIKKIITDMHGTVPEELIHEDCFYLGRLFNIVEWITIRYSEKIISVTQSMMEHFSCKYNRDVSSDLIIPIINQNIIKKVNRSGGNIQKNRPIIIYAGGMQKWQNVDKMLNSVKTQPGFDYLFLTGQPDEMREAAKVVGVENLKIQTVAPNEIDQYYAQAYLGFLLRDDILLNKVACPTKAVEYMASGIVPIVLSENIGDFKKLGYRYIKIDDFINSKLPISDEILKMSTINTNVIRDLIQQMNKGLSTLKKII